MNYLYKCREPHPYWKAPKKKCDVRVRVRNPDRRITLKKMFKRPIPRPRRPAPTQFVSAVQPSGGRVGEIINKMRNPTVRETRRREWTPPVDYEFIARHMTEAERGPWLAKCSAWFEAHPPPPPPPVPERPSVNHELIAALYAKWTRVEDGPRCPPIAERIEVYRAAGVSEELIAKAIARDAWLEETSEARQAALDAIFAKWPAASKPTPKTKPKPKVIKAVKKKH